MQRRQREPWGRRLSEAPGAVLARDAHRLADALGLSLREARYEAEVLLIRTTGLDRARLIAHPELVEQAAVTSVYQHALERRMRGEPVAYILGTREFYGLDFEVTPAVLIPRPETELLVELALERIVAQAHWDVLDVGTGSGCIAIALAIHRPSAHVVATDVSPDALEVAQRNAARHAAANLELLAGSVFAPVARRSFDLIVSNPPYIAGEDPHLHRGDLRFEPQHAPPPGGDGTALLQQLVAGAPARLHPGGWLLLEHGYDQAQAVMIALRAAGFVEVFTARDIAGHQRVSGGRLGAR